jgi:hypothetical protein
VCVKHGIDPVAVVPNGAIMLLPPVTANDRAIRATDS